MPLSNAEIDAVVAVLWHTHAIRSYYEDRALFEDEVMWKKNGGLFPNFSRYHSQKWKEMMGPDEPTVRGRRISRAAMAQARRDFEQSYREPIMFALKLVDRVRTAVAEAIDQNGPSKDIGYKEKAGRKAWEKVASDPSVKEAFAELAKNC
jgi:hypothetical protein